MPIYDLRSAFRSLLQAPLSTVASLAILAISVGTAAAAISVYHAVVVTALPILDQDRVVEMLPLDRARTELLLTAEELEIIESEANAIGRLAGVASFGGLSIPMSESDRPIVLDLAMATPNFFQLLGSTPAAGRLFGPEDSGPTAVISFRTWQRQFGGDPDIVGRTLEMTQDDATFTIIGVAPAGLDYPVGVDYWVLPGSPRQALTPIGRLETDVDRRSAATEFLGLVSVIDESRAFPRDPADVQVLPLADAILGDVGTLLFSFSAAAILLALVTSANIGGVLAIRAMRRRRSTMVRRALGASRSALIRPAVFEGLLLGVTGGGLGLVVGRVVLDGIVSLAGADLPRVEMVSLVSSPLIVVTAVAGAATLLFTIFPVALALSGNLAVGLRDTMFGASTRRGREIRQVLVGAQVALATIMLVGAGLLVRSFDQLNRVELGYEEAGLSFVELDIPWGLFGGGGATTAAFEEVFDRIRAVRGVTAVSLVMFRPFAGGAGIVEMQALPEGVPGGVPGAAPLVPIEVGGGEFFETLGVPILSGRGLRDTDTEEASRVVVVGRLVAERLWPAEDPIGRRIQLGGDDWWTVVGVAADTRFRDLRETTPAIYLHWRQWQAVPGVVTLGIRTDVDFSAVISTIRATLQDYDARIDVWRAGTMTDYLRDGPLARPRAGAATFSGIGLAALLISALGLFATISLNVRESAKAMGVRMALGATPGRVSSGVVVDALRISVGGALAGALVSVWASGILETALYGISPADPTTLAGVLLVVSLSSLAAAALPAWSATRLDPVRILRSE